MSGSSNVRGLLAERQRMRKGRDKVMELHILENRKRGGYTTFGGVWKKGEARGERFSLSDEWGRRIPVQSRIMAYWPDGSVKWSAHTADSERMGERVQLLPVLEEDDALMGGMLAGETSAGRKLSGGAESEWAEPGLDITENDGCYEVHTGKISLIVARGNALPVKYLACSVRNQEKLIAERIYPVFQLEQRGVLTEEVPKNVKDTRVQEFSGEVTSVELEQAGPLQAVFCFRGRQEKGLASMPFVIRMYLWADSEKIRFVHTFLYDGDEQRDYLKGMGIRFDLKPGGKSYNRHVQFASEGIAFHEAAVLLASRIPRLTEEPLRRQMNGELYQYGDGTAEEEAAADLPVWNHYSILQDSAWHYSIRKRTKEECCKLNCRQGKRANGVMAVTGENGGMLLGIRDFWQKCPSGLEVNGLADDTSRCTAWFYSPEAEAYDFRHYDTKSYPYSSYEGFEEVGASAYGIGVTSECQIAFTGGVPSEDEINAYAERIQKPCVYVGMPEYYHEKRAFGCWSLPGYETEMERWLEHQLEKAFAFYEKETENRSWYGLFDYGDVMHSYDAIRHTWKYDTGGFAWQNTELIPTYWLWIYFLRTGREDVFTFAEAMTRHCSEVDIYHFGEWKGLGSRHNVRHWGCSCKEPRIAMAGHHRFLYYLTGDLRLGDVLDEVRDADYSMVKIPQTQVQEPDGTARPGARSGPDWSSFVSNWMTAYERTLDEKWCGRIRAGIADIWETPFGLASGPDYYYDVESAHLIYRGEMENTPNQHLQICMGGLQVWLETADLLEDERLNILLERLGAFYLLSPEEKSRLTDGKIEKRPFSWPVFASGAVAYSAMRRGDAALAKQAWNLILGELLEKGGPEGYKPECYGQGEDFAGFQEIPWNTTNCTSQWCLNTMMCLEFIREYLPDTL